MFEEIVIKIIIPCFSAIFIALAGVLATQLKSILTERINTNVKRDVVEVCVKAAEQIYTGLNGKEKLEKVKKNAIKILDAKGIKISGLELDMFIESVVAEFNNNFYD